MADATDLKSVDRKVVWVRLPPSAPKHLSPYQSFVLDFLVVSFSHQGAWAKDDVKMT